VENDYDNVKDACVLSKVRRFQSGSRLKGTASDFTHLTGVLRDLNSS
jgi:hypothetical protein